MRFSLLCFGPQPNGRRTVDGPWYLDIIGPDWFIDAVINRLGVVGVG